MWPARQISFRGPADPAGLVDLAGPAESAGPVALVVPADSGPVGLANPVDPAGLVDSGLAGCCPGPDDSFPVILVWAFFPFPDHDSGGQIADPSCFCLP